MTCVCQDDLEAKSTLLPFLSSQLFALSFFLFHLFFSASTPLSFEPSAFSFHSLELFLYLVDPHGELPYTGFEDLEEGIT